MTPKRYQDLVLWAWPQVNCNPNRYQNKTKPVIFIIRIGYWVGSIALFPLLKVLESTVINLYLISNLKGTTKVTPGDVLKLNTLKGTKTTFLTPKRCDKHPRHFYMGVPSPGFNDCNTVFFNKTRLLFLAFQ